MITSAHSAHVLFPTNVSWKDDYENRVNPPLMTSLLHKAIPVLKEMSWKIVEVREGFCRSLLPLSAESTNQHGTHQAALIALSADYTGGMALTTLLRGVPLAGIHCCREEESVALWLASMSVKYRNPSTGHLTATCDIPKSVQDDIRRRYFSGKRVLVTLDVKFWSNGELICEAEMRYFAQPSIQLRPTPAHPRLSVLYKNKLKASARMIAGVRASSTTNRRISFQCPHSRAAAGPHGNLLADKLQSSLPQLRDMVLARTQHIDEVILANKAARQIVLLGAGLDFRPFRLKSLNPDMTFFELDLPEMLEERQRVVQSLIGSSSLRRRMIGTNFVTDPLEAALGPESGFDRDLPTIFVYEGCSMYFSREVNAELLRGVARLMNHPSSLLWCDLVTSSVVDGTTTMPEVAAFVLRMEEMGEAFVFGTDVPCQLMAECGFDQCEITSSGQFLGEQDPVYGVYNLVVARRTAQDRIEATNGR